MATSYRAFLAELYEEYLEEASFLYEQRLGLLDDPEVTWRDIGEFEERFEAHVDGLVVGGKLALEVCRRRAAEGDFGELHAAVRVFCRQGRDDLLMEVLEQLDPEDPEAHCAVGDALKLELPEGLEDEICTCLAAGGPGAAFVLATVSGYRRLARAPDLLALLAQAPGEAVRPVLWALGRCGQPSTAGPLVRYLLHEDPEVCSSAALSLLRLGEPSPLDYCLQRAPLDSWPQVALALGGGRKTAADLLEVVRAGSAPGPCLVALGVLGDAAGVHTLLDSLQGEESAAAALGLYALTGAGLFEDVFVPEEVEEEELFEVELERWQMGEAPGRGDGQSFGTTVRRLSQDASVWGAWWEENRSLFAQDTRYRCGRPCSAASLVEVLQAEDTPHLLRRLTAEELATRYACPVPFEADMVVPDQERAIAQLAEWARGNGARFREGRWYFAGRELE